MLETSGSYSPEETIEETHYKHYYQCLQEAENWQKSHLRLFAPSTAYGIWCWAISIKTCGIIIRDRLIQMSRSFSTHLFVTCLQNSKA